MTNRYPCTVLSVYDGDTFTALVGLGFSVSTKAKIRVRDLFCPELREAGGRAAHAYAATLLKLSAVDVEPFEDRRSFDRWVCDVYCGGELFRVPMVEAGHGAYQRFSLRNGVWSRRNGPKGYRVV